MDQEKNKALEGKIELKEIPLNSCKLVKIKNKKLAVCHEPNGEFKVFELKPIGFHKERSPNIGET